MRTKYGNLWLERKGLVTEKEMTGTLVASPRCNMILQPQRLVAELLLSLPFPTDQELFLPKKTIIIINIKMPSKEIIEEIKENN
jgi:hypothetical protein